MEIFGERNGVLAARDHDCTWCDQKITAGTRYNTWAYSEDGKIERIRAHPECAHAWALAGANEPGGTFKTEPHLHQRGSTEPL